MAEFKISRIRYTWQGNWDAGSAYKPDDVVRYEGKAYVCLVQHTADNDFYTDLNFVNTDVPPLAVPKWELMFDGFAWKGAWAFDTFYSVGDLAKYHGITYVCTESHTSASDMEGFETDLSNWAVYLQGESWQGVWSPATYYVLRDQVRANGIVYRCIISHTSQPTNPLGIEPDVIANRWEIVADTDAWRGEWTSDTRYRASDIVLHGGITYKCITGHTSDAYLEMDQSKWEVIHSGIDYKADWEAQEINNNPTGTRYKINDVVKFGGDLFICIGNHTSGSVWDDNYWSLWQPGFEFDNIWAGGIYYQPGDVVRYGGYLYVSKTVNNGKTPSTEPDNWSLASKGYRMAGEWTSTEPYVVGDVVNYGGYLYSAVETSVGEQPAVGTATNTDYWEVTIPGSDWQGIWQSTRTYKIGELVTWISKTYRCINVHFSEAANRPDLDVTYTYWELVVVGDSANRLRNIGDIKIYTEGATTNVPIGFKGSVLKSTNGKPQWGALLESEKVYYVSPDGTDSPENGTTLASAWRTIRYACDQITGYATIYVKTGLYQEILPIRIPSFVAIVGDELRGAVVEPAPTLVDPSDIPYSLSAMNYLKSTMQSIIQNQPLGTLYTEIPQDVSLPVSTPTTAGYVEANLQIIINMLELENEPEMVGTNTATTDADRLKAIDIIASNKQFLIEQVIGYIQDTFNSYSFDTVACSRDVSRYIDALMYDLEYPGNYKSIEAARYYLHATDGELNASQDMFLMRDGTGIRNMTLRGLIGTLTPSTTDPVLRRPTGGAYTAFDPGWGPDDDTAWVGTRSPYIQNVTNFGTCCVGLRLDGDLHNGGNKTIVSNDYTQVLSDGIGIWVSKDARTEAVSVFTYYNHIGYLADFGGKIRATNGNNSYGTYGSVSTDVNPTEIPITATVNNRSYEASVQQVFCSDNGIEKIFFSNAGQSYSSATFTITGGGTGVSVVGDEIRDGAVSEVRIVDPGDSSAAGGGSYVYTTNNAQNGTSTAITLAASDQNLEANYLGMRIFIRAGTGAGQYGYIYAYDDVSKIATIYKETTDTIGWDHINAGTTTASILDTSTVYSLEPRVTFSSPGATVTAGTLPATKNWTSICYGDVSGGRFVAVSTDVSGVTFTAGTTAAYSSNGVSWTVSTLPAAAKWTAVAYGNGLYIAISQSGIGAYSEDGITWTETALPDRAWTSLTFNEGKFVAMSDGSYVSAYTDDGVSWTQVVMPDGADWSSITYGKGKFVAVAYSDSSLTTTAYSNDGITWGIGSFAGGASCIAYGQGKFIAFDGATLGDTVFWSENGTSWNSLTLPVAKEWKSVTYGHGKFVAVAAGSTVGLMSDDGINWVDTPSLGSETKWRSIAFGNPINSGKFVAVAGGTGGSNAAAVIATGATTQARVTVVSGRISAINIWEPGSGYTSAPVMTLTDPNNTSNVAVTVRLNNGVIGNPSFINRGSGYQTNSSSATITGDGFKDEYQLGKYLVVSNLSRLPSPGDNLNVDGINDYTYKVTAVETLSGTAPNIEARITFIKAFNRAEAPEHGTTVNIRQAYSQVRITGHDLLDIGLGNFEQTNYPDTLYPNGTVAAPENELVERNGGRVFYTSTDQFGNFRVGELFAVEQATGTVTLNAEFFELQGLEELRLGGVSVGGTGVVIREFSTDSTFTADSNNIVTTQRAIKAYLTSRVSGGGSDAITGGVTAGTVIVGPNKFDGTGGTPIQVPVNVNFKGGVDGMMLAMPYFVKRN